MYSARPWPPRSTPNLTSDTTRRQTRTLADLEPFGSTKRTRTALDVGSPLLS
jgi:hypothetical protein